MYVFIKLYVYVCTDIYSIHVFTCRLYVCVYNLHITTESGPVTLFMLLASPQWRIVDVYMYICICLLSCM